MWNGGEDLAPGNSGSYIISGWEVQWTVWIEKIHFIGAPPMTTTYRFSWFLVMNYKVRLKDNLLLYKCNSTAFNKWLLYFSLLVSRTGQSKLRKDSSLVDHIFQQVQGAKELQN